MLAEMVRRGLVVVLALAGQGCNPGTNGTGSSASESGSTDTGTTATSSTDSSSESGEGSTTGDEGCELSPSTEPTRTVWVEQPDPGFAVNLNQIVVTALGSVVVAGEDLEGVGGTWLASHTDAGSLEWSTVDESHGAVASRSLAPDPIGGIVALAAGVENVWVSQYASDGAPGWSEEVDLSFLYEGAGDDAQILVGGNLATTSNGDVYACAWGEVTWTQPEEGVNRNWSIYRIPFGGGAPELVLPLPDLVHAFVAASAEDELIVFGKLESNWDEGWIGKLTTSGEEIWSRTVDGEPYNRVYEAAGVVGGRTLWTLAEGPNASTGTFLVGMLDATGEDEWLWSDPACDAVYLGEVAAENSLNLVTRYHELPGGQHFLQALDGGGAAVWVEPLPESADGPPPVLATTPTAVYAAAPVGEGLDIRYYLARIAL
jgi:hypothetical protein